MYHDRNVKAREYKPGDKVLVFSPLRGNPLQANYHGPFKVPRKVDDHMNVLVSYQFYLKLTIILLNR